MDLYNWTTREDPARFFQVHCLVAFRVLVSSAGPLHLHCALGALCPFPALRGLLGWDEDTSLRWSPPPPPVTFVHPFVRSFIFFTQHSFYSSVDIKGDEYLALPVKSPASWAPILRMCWKGKNSRTGKVGSFKVIGAKDGE